MARLVFARRLLSQFSTTPSILARIPTSRSSWTAPTNPHRHLQLPTLIPPATTDPCSDFNIELVDSDAWRLSFGVAQSHLASDPSTEPSPPSSTETPAAQQSPDFDEIEDLRHRKNLFYKLDRGSREFEECSVNFHLRKSSKKTKKDIKKPERPNLKQLPGKKCSSPIKKQEVAKKCRASIEEQEVGKKARTPTFNQVTDPYHLPFCLDIYITKGSVRACIVHRVTSKVVAVAHSISKDMKFDLSSRKDPTACAAVGRVLAQRAIEDDIHNVVYTPRKGDVIEGKLQIVLQSVIENGVDVKVKLKQRKPVKVL